MVVAYLPQRAIYLRCFVYLFWPLVPDIDMSTNFDLELIASENLKARRHSIRRGASYFDRLFAV